MRKRTAHFLAGMAAACLTAASLRSLPALAAQNTATQADVSATSSAAEYDEHEE